MHLFWNEYTNDVEYLLEREHNIKKIFFKLKNVIWTH